MAFLVALFVTAADQYTKRNALAKQHTVFVNKGIALALYQGNNTAITIYLLGLLLLGYILNSSAPNDYAFAIYLGGLFSNALDYVHRDGVVDWLHVNSWRINLADIAITLATLFWIGSIVYNLLISLS